MPGAQATPNRARHHALPRKVRLLGALVAAAVGGALAAAEEPVGWSFLGMRERGDIMAEAVEAKYEVAADPRLDRIAEKILRFAEPGSAGVAILVVGERRTGGSYDGVPCTYPGGHIYVPGAWLKLIGKDESALAMLLAHEIAHHTYHFHGAEVEDDHVALALAGGLDEALERRIAKPAERERVKALVQEVVAAKRRLGQQHKEFEADSMGAVWALRAGYEFDGAIRLMELIRKNFGEGAFGGPGLLGGVADSTHPSIAERLSSLEKARARVLEAPASFESGLEALGSEDHRNAIASFNEILEFFPGSCAAWNNLGVAHQLKYWRSGGGGAPAPKLLAETALEPALLAKAGAPRFRSRGGRVESSLDEAALRKAQESYRKALELCPSSSHARNNLAAALLDSGKARAALALWSQLDPRGPESRLAVLRNVGLAAYRLSSGGARLPEAAAARGMRSWEEYLAAKSDPEVAEKLGEWKKSARQP